MGAIESALDQFRRPEYTGENRCYPCTVVNLTIALVAAIATVVLVGGTEWAGYAYPAGVAVFLVCSVPIALRGYLVPGTPTLTKRYMPASVLSLFGKEPAGPAFEDDGADVGEFDVEGYLLSAGALEPMPDGEDLQLDPAVREQWRVEIEQIRDEEVDRGRLADIMGVPEDALSFREFSDSFRAFRDQTNVGTWESKAAYVADVAAAPILEERIDEWAALSAQDRGRLLNGLRIFLEDCPDCDGPLSFGKDTVQSCCSSREVAALTCEDCEARLFESRPL